ncbi:Myo7b, partial [Symbiodinium pilosum]
MTDGTVVTWGSSNNGGDSSAVASQLTDIVQISGARCKFTARKSTGKAIMWGGNSGCDSSAQNHFDHFSSNNELDDVVNLAVHELDFAALKADGTARGFGEWGRQTPSLSNVQDVFTTHREGVGAIDGSGNVKTWGRGGTTLSGVQSVYSNWFSYTFFAYRKTDGTVTSTWSAPSSPPTDVQDVKMTGNAVAALKTDGTVQVVPIYRAFAARKSDGSVVAWGEASNGGDASAVADQLSSGIINAADGTVVAWGNSGLKVAGRRFHWSNHNCNHINFNDNNGNIINCHEDNLDVQHCDRDKHQQLFIYKQYKHHNFDDDQHQKCHQQQLNERHSHNDLHTQQPVLIHKNWDHNIEHFHKHYGHKHCDQIADPGPEEPEKLKEQQRQRE